MNDYGLSINSEKSIIGLTSKDVCYLSYIIKHPSYKYEEESRIVFLDCSQSYEINYKVLYVPLAAVKKIVCGPCVDENLVRTILQNIYEVDVKQSEIKYTDTPPKMKFIKNVQNPIL